MDNLGSFLEQSSGEFLVLCLCETWHTSKPPPLSSLEDRYNLMDSVAIRERSRGRASGGLMIYYSKQLKAQPLDITPWWILTLLTSDTLSFILCLVYFKPSLNMHYILESFQLLLVSEGWSPRIAVYHLWGF